MSILNTNQTPELTRPERKARRVKQGAKQLADQLISGWEQGFDSIWNDEDPASILVELGTDAAEIFALSAATVQLFGSILPNRRPDDWARIDAKAQSMPATTANPDGTVTID
jgi:hypothetical protein